MFFRLFIKAALACAIVFASTYTLLQAQQDSSLPVPKTNSKPFWIWQIGAKQQPFGSDREFNQRISTQIKNYIYNPNYLNPIVTFSPINVMWNHNRWLLLGSYFTGGTSVGRDTSISRVLHEVTLGFGYVAINTPRFRLYPMVAATGMIDLITITQPTTFNALLAGSNPYSFTVQRGGGVLEVAIGADYSVPLEYGDIYVMTKIGYNFEAGANWAYGGQSLPDTDSNWFSRRGIFFQIGVGFGTERQ